MKMMLYVSVLCLLALLLGAASCVSRPAGTPGMGVNSSNDALSAKETQAPYMFREAGLPLGFPPPGPVGEIILKEYPAYRAARTAASAGTADASGAMFKPLFQHIKKNDISMTAPVEMTYAADAAGGKDQPIAMAFMYGDPHLGQTGEDGGVKVIDLPPRTVLSVTLRGGYEASFEKGIALLREWLSTNPGRYEVAGPPRFLGYNSPFVPPFLRIGEVQLPVQPAAIAPHGPVMDP